MLRSLYETSLDISILAMIETYVLNFDTWGYKISFGLTITNMVLLFSLALFIRIYLRRIDIKDQNISRRIGAIYDGLILKKSSLIQPEWFIYRRIIFAAAAFYGMGNFWL